MSRYGNLRSDEKLEIESKLSELSSRTGKRWDYVVVDKRGEELISPLLEVVVDGRTSQPIPLPDSEQCPATVICEHLETHAGSAAVMSFGSR